MRHPSGCRRTTDGRPNTLDPTGRYLNDPFESDPYSGSKREGSRLHDLHCSGIGGFILGVEAEWAEHRFNGTDFAQCNLNIGRRGALRLLQRCEQNLYGRIALGGECVGCCIVRLGVGLDELFRIGITGVDIPRTRHDESVSRCT